MKKRKVDSTLSRRGWQLATVVALSGLWAGSASATLVNKMYDVSKCLGASDSTNTTKTSDWSFSSVGGLDTIKNKSGGPLVIWCPIPKTTSGPGISNDAFDHITIPVLTTTGNTVACDVNIWDSFPSTSQGTSNLVVPSMAGSRSSNGTITINHPSSGNPTDFWDGFGITGEDWFFMDFTCTVPNGSSLQSYKVYENGTAQTASGAMILPAGYCAQSSLNTATWEYNPKPDLAAGGSGGYIEEQGGSTPPFEFACQVEENVAVDFAVLPPIGYPISPANVIGCNLGTSGLGTAMAPTLDWSYNSGDTHTYGGQFAIPFVLLGMPTNSETTLFCGSPDTDGDGALISYREINPRF